MGLINKIRMSIHDALSPVLSDRAILKYMDKGLLIDQHEDPISSNQIQPNSIDLRIGNNVLYLDSNAMGTKYDVHTHHLRRNMCFIDPSYKMIHYEYKPTFSNDAVYVYANGSEPSLPREAFTIEPKQFCLLTSKETLYIPNGIVAFVCGRSSIARMGIQTEQAGLIDAGFHGQITFEVYNQTEYPIRLYKGMRVAQVYFLKAQYAASIYGGLDKKSKYQGQRGATGSRIYNDPELKQRTL